VVKDGTGETAWLKVWWHGKRKRVGGEMLSSLRAGPKLTPWQVLGSNKS